MSRYNRSWAEQIAFHGVVTETWTYLGDGWIEWKCEPGGGRLRFPADSLYVMERHAENRDDVPEGR